MTKKITYLIGILIPLYYFIILSLIGQRWPGYSWTRNYMSELGGVESPYMILMNIAGFMGVGLAMILVSHPLYDVARKNTPLKISALSLAISGLFMIIVGFFPCDPQCIDVTFTGKMHTLTSMFPAIFLPTAAILAGVGFMNQKKKSNTWAIASIALGISSFAAGTAMSFPQLSHLTGLFQRLGIGFGLAWVALISLKMLIQKSQNQR
jgi:hypothetical membrane protein